MASAPPAGAAALKDVDVDEIARLIEKLKPGNPEVRRAVRALAALGSLAVGPLIIALESGPWQVRQQAAKALGAIGDVRAVEPLIGALGHGRLRVRGQAARALGAIGDERAAEPLVAVLRDRVAEVRGEATEALVRIGGARTVSALIAALKNGSGWRMRPEAAEVLGEIARRGDPVPELRAALPILNQRARSIWAGKALKEVCRTVAAQIEEATAALKDLPLPAAASSLSSENLPLPSRAPRPHNADGEAAEPPAASPAPPGWRKRLLRALGLR